MQVGFLICGAQKAGTTTLAAYCREHPALGMPEEKELHFFDRDENFASAPDYDQYHHHFQGLDSSTLLGEATPIYMYWPQASERIHQYNADMKLLVVLRNPVDRAYSHWQMEYHRGLETLDFGTAIREEEQRLQKAGETRRVWSYIDRGHYPGQLDKLFSLFGRDQVLVLQSEKLKSAYQDVLAQVSDFLGIAAFPESDGLSLNTQSYTTAMPEADRQFLHQIFAEDISRLESMLDWDLTAWR
jgi:hypothetical protein